jgi:hypothetical protein
MKKIILLSLLSFSMFSQTNTELDDITKGLNLLNNIRMFNMLKPLKLNSNLNELAKDRAIQISKNDIYIESPDSTGESYFWSKSKRKQNYYNAILGLALNTRWAVKHTYTQMNCRTCTSVGFGKSKNNNKNYFFIVYDSIR